MKSLKIAFVVIAPALVAGVIGCGLYALTGDFNGLFSHDVCEAHTHAALIPFITVLAVALGYLPALFYCANVAFPVANPVPAQDQATAADMIQAPAPALLHVGQTFTSAGANCVLRVKAIKPII